MSPYTLPGGNISISFSGGRTSAYMLHQIVDANGGLPDRAVVSFQNTGREADQTLDFVQECASRWGVNVVWLEYRANKPLFERVSHNSASRNGEPFEALIFKKKYLPNQQMRFCTQELKVKTVRRYLLSLGWTKWTNATGIRADEPRRHKPHLRHSADRRYVDWQPLVQAGVTKADVMSFWDAHPFDLGLEVDETGSTYLGNCDGCFLKSEHALTRLARENPKAFAWWEDMEEKVAQITGKESATFSKRCSRFDLRDHLERQGDWILEMEGALCQADDGECTE